MDKDCVVVPKATIVHLMEYWNGNRNDRAMWDALNHIMDELQALLAAAPIAQATQDTVGRDLQLPLNERERAVLGAPHPGDFGIPKEWWEQTKHYAEFVIENRKAAAPKPDGDALTKEKP